MPLRQILTCMTPFAASSCMALTVCLWLHLCQVWHNPLQLPMWTACPKSSVIQKGRKCSARGQVLSGFLEIQSLLLQWFCTSIQYILDWRFFFGETFVSLLLIYSVTYFKAPGACLLILATVLLSPWWTADLKIQILHRTGWSQPFSLSYAYKIVVVTGLPAFINVSAAWICTCAITLSPAKKRMINDALGYSQLPWERFKIWVKHETVAHPSRVSLF